MATFIPFNLTFGIIFFLIGKYFALITKINNVYSTYCNLWTAFARSGDSGADVFEGTSEGVCGVFGVDAVYGELSGTEHGVLVEAGGGRHLSVHFQGPRSPGVLVR